MGNQGFIKEVKIDAIARAVADELDKRNHGLNGTVLLLPSSNYTGSAGQSPLGYYQGFMTGSSGATISAITYWEDKHQTYGNETLNDLGIDADIYYAIDDIKQVTISAGAILLYRKNSNL